MQKVDRRFELAKQLLSTTELTVEVVAANAGFSSSASLYREFKKRMGLTPDAFRQEQNRSTPSEQRR